MHAIGRQWVYRKKINADRSIQLKARLVIQGYEQIQGSDYGETYAPVAKLVSFHLLLAMAARNNRLVYHIDVVTAFLNPLVEEDIYMHVPEAIEWLEPSFSVEDKQICKFEEIALWIKASPLTLVSTY